MNKRFFSKNNLDKFKNPRKNLKKYLAPLFNEIISYCDLLIINIYIFLKDIITFKTKEFPKNL